jgi:iron(III) transport system ATP-binding protein
VTALPLTASRLTRRADGRAILHAASLSAPAGKVTALLGASGAGKSTLLRVLAGLDTPDEGEVRLGDRVLSRPGLVIPPEARGIGLVFQDYALFPHLTAAQNVGFGLDRLAPTERRARALDGLARVGLADRAGAFPHELSGGEQQRVALARALAPAPGAVLLDEPFSSLDPGLRADVRAATFEALKGAGVTALLVTHDAQEALDVADWLAVMDAGTVVQEGVAEALYASPATLAAAAAFGPLNLAPGGPDTPFGRAPAGRPGLIAIRPEGLVLHEGQGARVVEVRGVGPDRWALITPESQAGPVWRARLSPGQSVTPGRAVAVAFDPAGVFVFDIRA